MGNIFEAECSCGYVSNRVRPRCPKCRHKVVVLDIEQANADERSTSRMLMDFECPRCHRSTMRLAEAGLWD